MIFETVWWKLSSSAICPRWLERWYFGKMSQVTALCENYIGLRRKRDLIRLSDLPLRSWNFLRRELRWDGGVKQRRWRGAQISLFTEEVQIVCKKCRDKKKKKNWYKTAFKHVSKVNVRLRLSVWVASCGDLKLQSSPQKSFLIFPRWAAREGPRRIFILKYQLFWKTSIWLVRDRLLKPCLAQA